MKKKPQTKLYEWQMRCQRGEGVCRCGETKQLTVDHIVPCHILEQFAFDKLYLLYNMEENFEILCKYCNHMKAGRIDPKNPKTYEVLLMAIGKAKADFIK